MSQDVHAERLVICLVLTVSDWFKAAQLLYAIAVIVMVVTLFMVFTAACLRESVYKKVAKAAGSLMLIAGMWPLYGRTDGRTKQTNKQAALIFDNTSASA